MTDTRAALIVALVAFAAYAAGLGWGLPHATGPDRVDSWGVDDEAPLGPLAEIHNIIEPKANRNLGYPLLYSFVVAAAYSPYFAYLWATDGVRDLTPLFPFGLADPVSSLRTLALIAHLVTALMATAVVLGAFAAAHLAWGRRAGVIAALFAMTASPMFYYARTGNVDVPMLCFIALAFAAFAYIVVLGHTVRRAVLLGALVGLALATKEAAFGAFLGMPFVVLGVYRKQHPELAIGDWRFWKPHVLALGAALLALGAGSGLFVEPGRYLAHLRYLTSRVTMMAEGNVTAPVATFSFTLSGHAEYAWTTVAGLTSILTVGGLALALAGIVISATRRERAALLILPALTYLAYIFITLRVAQFRYLLPAAFLLAPFAARGTLAAWQARSAAVRVAGLSVAALVLVVQSLRGADLTYQMINDSRFAAGRWLTQHARPGDRIEYFGPSQKLPPLDAEWPTERAAEYRGMYVQARVDDAMVKEILAGWRERGTRFVIELPDHTSPPGVPHSHTFPPSLFDDMLRDLHGFRLVARFRTPPLFPWLPAIPLDYPTVNPPIHIFEAVHDPG
ncbi:MAG: glycosyltransferase family 39 protein [Longimicrobiales bacterium]